MRCQAGNSCETVTLLQHFQFGVVSQAYLLVMIPVDDGHGVQVHGCGENI